MATKVQELILLANNKGCLGKAKADEPLFILKGSDLLAPEVVETWIAKAREAGTPEPKLDEAGKLVKSMRCWQREHGGKLPD